MREIVGVVANVRQSPLGPEPEPIYYLPLRQMTWGQTSFIVRASSSPRSTTTYRSRASNPWRSCCRRARRSRASRSR
jgi:hypothetical protein